MTAPGFVDTNILVYAFADTADDRHSKARLLVEGLLAGRNATVSVQVLKEFYTVATRKVKRPLPHNDAVAVVKDLSLTCTVVDDTLPQLDRALELVGEHSLSIWDAAIVAAAEAGGCATLYTEDLSHGATVGNVSIANPFLSGEVA